MSRQVGYAKRGETGRLGASREPERGELGVTYGELARGYNKHLVNLDRLLSQVTVVMRWQDPHGKQHTVQGDGGRLAVILPNKILLQVKHIGRRKPVIWAGSDGNRYWVFDNRDAQKNWLYVGQVDRPDGQTLSAGSSRGARALPLPIKPALLPYVLGMVKLPLALPGIPGERGVPGGAGETGGGGTGGHQVMMGKQGNQYLLSFPISPGVGLRMTIDAKTFFARQIDLIDLALGKTVLVARLSNYQSVEIAGVPPDGRTRMATSIYFSEPGSTDTLKLTLPGQTLRNTGLKDAWFTLEPALRYYQTPREQQVDMDQPAPPRP